MGAFIRRVRGTLYKINQRADFIVSRKERELFMDDSLRFTEWLDPDKQTICHCGAILSKYGCVSNRKWLELELERIQSNGKKCHIVSENGQEALFYVEAAAAKG